MASIKDTAKDLNVLENKAKALSQALRELQSVESVAGNANLSQFISGYEAKMQELIRTIGTYKTALRGIGSSGTGLEDINRRLTEQQRRFETIASNTRRLRQNNNILGPTTYAEDARANSSGASQAQVAGEIASEATNKVKSRLSALSSTMKSVSSGISNAVNKVVGVIRSGLKVITTVINGAIKLVTTLGRGVKSVISLFGNLGNRIRGTSSNMKGLSGTATELYSKLNLLKMAFNTLFNGEAVQKAQKLFSAIQTTNVIAGGQATDEVIEWAKAYEYAFGLSARDLISQMQELTGVMYGLGMSGEDAVLASKNLSMMGNYLASIGFAGGDANAIMDKLTSGMKGMTAAVDDLGISVRDAEMDSFLENLRAQGGQFANIATDFSSLNEEARVYIRYAAMIKQFTDNFDISSMASQFNTVTGRINLFKSSVSTLVSTLGSGLIQVFAKLTSVLIPVVNFVTGLITKLFGFFGISVDLSSSLNGTAGALKDIGGVDTSGLDATKEALDGVSGSADKAKGSLQGFDRVNNVTSSGGSKGSGGSGGSGGGIGGADYSSLMTSMLDELDKKAKEASKSYAKTLHDEMMKNLKKYWNKFTEYAKKVTGRADFDLGFDWAQIKENFETVFSNLKKIVPSYGTIIISLGLKILDDLNIGTIITDITNLIASLTNLANTASDIVGPVLSNFYDKYISPLVKGLGGAFHDVLVDAKERVDDWNESLSNDKSGTIEKWTKRLDDLVAVFKKDKEPNGLLDQFALMLGNVYEVGKSLWPIIQELADRFAKFASNELLPWINEKLGELADWLTANKDEIVEFLSDLASFVWDSFKVFVDLVGKLIDFVVKHPTAVKVFLAGLVGIKITGWALGAAAGLGQLLTGLQGLTTLASSGSLATLSTQLSGLGGALKTVASKAGPIAAIGGLATAEVGALDSALIDGGLWTDVKSLFSGEFFDILPRETVIDWANKYFALAQKYVDEGIFTMDEARNTMLNAFESNLQESGYTVEQIELMMEQFTNHLDSHIEDDISTWADDWWGVSEEAAKWADDAFEKMYKTEKAVVDSNANIANNVIETHKTCGKSLDDVLAESDKARDGIISGGESLDEVLARGRANIASSTSETTKTVGKSLDEVLAECDKTRDGVISGVNETTANLETNTQKTGVTLAELTGTTDRTREHIKGGLDDVLAKNNSTTDGVVSATDRMAKGYEDSTHRTGVTLAELTGTTDRTREHIKGGLDDVLAKTASSSTGINNSVGSVSDKFAESDTSIGGTLSRIISKVTTAAQDIANKASSIGTNMVEGVRTGLNSSESSLLERIGGFASSIVSKVKNVLGIHSPSRVFADIGGYMAEGLNNGVSSAWGSVTNNMTSLVTGLVDKSKSGLMKLGSLGKEAVGDLASSVSNTEVKGLRTIVTNKWNSVTSGNSAKKITSHAVGGSIAGGQLFIANESGNAELIGNIDGSSKTNVANNNMIIEAMTNGVFTGVYNAIAEASNQRSNVGAVPTTTTIKVDGFGLIDSSTLNELARLLAPYLESNNNNIANIGFSI